MAFDYDPKKSAANKTKHGIDFNEARALWDDPDGLILPALTMDEPRYMVLGKMDGKHWAAIITYRNAAIRIILKALNFDSSKFKASAALAAAAPLGAEYQRTFKG